MSETRESTLEMGRWIANPNRAFISATIFLGVWTSLGVADHLIFRSASADPGHLATLGCDPEQTISWVNDYLGHWFVLSAVILSVLLKYWNTQMKASLTDVLKGRLNERFDEHLRLLTPIAAAACIALALGNWYVVSRPTADMSCQWQYIAPQSLALPATVGPLFLTAVFCPLLMSAYRFAFFLNGAADDVRGISSFNTRDPKGLFGLQDFGQLIAVTAILFFVSFFPLVVIQILQKEDLTAGNVFGALGSFVLVYYVVVRPSMLFHKNLIGERIEFTNQVIEFSEQVSLEIRQAPSDMPIDVLELRREHNQAELDLAKRMKTVPISIAQKIAAAVAALPTLITPLMKILEKL